MYFILVTEGEIDNTYLESKLREEKVLKKQAAGGQTACLEDDWYTLLFGTDSNWLPAVMEPCNERGTQYLDYS